MFRVCFPHNSKINIHSQFKELIKNKEKLPEVKKFKRQWQYVGNVGDDWKRDLEAYRLKKSMTLKEVIKELGTKVQKENCDDGNVRRNFNRYIRNARNIIETLEQGYFPRE